MGCSSRGAGSREHADLEFHAHRQASFKRASGSPEMKRNPGACTRTSPPVVVTVIDCDPSRASSDESVAAISSANAEGLESVTNGPQYFRMPMPPNRTPVVNTARTSSVLSGKPSVMKNGSVWKPDSGGDADAFVDAGVPHGAGIQKERRDTVLE